MFCNGSGYFDQILPVFNETETYSMNRLYMRKFVAINHKALLFFSFLFPIIVLDQIVKLKLELVKE
ncbi:hypothetical protein A4R26_09425 [Niastella populi]|uniref:Uncharacterized protein n=1 Tax=Niastella populi TaxID=550983 RepID=A0A1V9EHV0_9BACT|nr:hypothetical protein A4R26_09425 [Niastella populi]